MENVPNAYESLIGCRIICEFGRWDTDWEHGPVTGASAPVRFGPRQVRMPDAAFTSWDRLPVVDVPDLVPNLAIEVLNPANTPGEVCRKLADYFTAGVECVWCAEPRRRIVEVYSSPDDMAILKPGQALDGGAVPPGFALPVAKIFEKRAPAKRPGKKGKKA